MSVYRDRIKEQSTLRFAQEFGVAVESAQSFGRWRTGLGMAKEVCAMGAGFATLAATGGAILPTLGVTFGASVAGRFLINKLLPTAFPKAGATDAPKPKA